MSFRVITQSALGLGLFALTVGAAAPALAQRVGAEPSPTTPIFNPPWEIDRPNPYYEVWPAGMKTARSWGDPGRGWGSTSAIDIADNGESVWVFDRCGSDHSNCSEALHIDPLMKFDRNGKLLLAFGKGMFFNPHGLTIDNEGNLWTTDAGGPSAAQIAAIPALRGIGHRAVKFSPTGRVLMTIGTGGVAGAPPTHLTSPTGLAVAPNGDIFISEGHSGANRVSKFRADGTFVKSWGQTGTNPGQFQLPHAIATDSQGRVFVADRTNYRIQIFDGDGNYIDSWKQFGRPSGIYIDAADNLYVTDSHSWGDEDRVDGLPIRKGIRVGSARTGEVRAYLPDLEVFTHANSGGEGVAADPQGNIYSAVVRRLGVEKFNLQAPEDEGPTSGRGGGVGPAAAAN